MKAEREGNFSVNGPHGIALVGFLTRKANGDIMVTPNAPPVGISEPDIPTVIAAVRSGKKQVTIDSKVLKVEIIWSAEPRFR